MQEQELFPTELLNHDSGASFSHDHAYRYKLWRVWDFGKPWVMFIGLNPSTANENTDDPTIRRVISMAKSWGYGGVYMMNLFCFVTAYPKELDLLKENIKVNNYWLKTAANDCATIVFAWGNFNVLGRDKEVIEMFPDAYALHINKNGSPKHPLYVKSNTTLKIFSGPLNSN